jgi:hypothetical protein
VRLLASVRSVCATVATAGAAFVACGDDAGDARAPGHGAVGSSTDASAGGTGGAGSTTSGAQAGGHGGADDCGPFEPDGDGDDDGPRHDGPADPEVLAGCAAWCDELGGACGPSLVHDACVDACRLRACHACRGTFVPVVDCERAEIDRETCTCEGGVPRCPVAPSRCSDYLDASRQCAADS